MFTVIANPSKAVSQILRASLANVFAIHHQKLITFATLKDGPFNFINGKRTPVSSTKDTFQVLNPATGKVTE